MAGLEAKRQKLFMRAAIAVFLGLLFAAQSTSRLYCIRLCTAL